MNLLSASSVAAAAENVRDKLLRGGVADLRPMPSRRQPLRSAPSVRLETAPGGHLGVLTGVNAEATTWRYLDEFLLDWDWQGQAPLVGRLRSTRV